MLCNVDTLVCVLRASFLSDCSTKISSPFLSPPKTSIFSPPVTNLCFWLERKGARRLCPTFKSPFPTHCEVLHNSGAASLDKQLLR